MANTAEPRQPSDGWKYNVPTCDMDLSQPSTSQYAQSLPQSAACSDITSPAQSFFSKAHSARSGSTASSIPSSPVMRESLDIFAPSKRFLTDVKEEPQEREDADMSDVAETSSGRKHAPKNSQILLDPPMLGYPRAAAHYDFSESETSDEHLPSTPSFKKRRSGDSGTSLVATRVGTRLNSLSRKWKSKNGASPKLSIVTHSNSAEPQRSSVPCQLESPPLSLVSTRESLARPSSALVGSEDSSTTPLPLSLNTDPANMDEEDDQGQATTPLLPPAMAESSSSGGLFHSPFQSPTVAEASSEARSPVNSTTPDGTPQMPCLPSPPISSKPSLASIRQRSRVGTLVPSSEIPPISMLDQSEGDVWGTRLGHANFAIDPQPYLPGNLDIGAFNQFRKDWAKARKNYARHLARTGEHYGTTSKTFLLTEEKWALVDNEWKHNDEKLTLIMGSRIAPGNALGTDTSNASCSSGVPEQPPTKVVVPNINPPSGKFPDMGDEDIVGPMAVRRMADPAMYTRPPKKRKFFKFISGFLSRGVGSGIRT